MVKNHLKSLYAPKTWQVKRKKEVYITRPSPSGQKMRFVLPLNIIFKDYLKYCKTSKEVRLILNEKEILLDGKRIKEPHTALGLFSVLTITQANESFRLTINKRGKLELKKIDKKEADIKPCVIKNKTVLSKDKIQVNLSDGRNIILKKNDYKTGDTLIIKLPGQEVKEHIKFDKGAKIILTGGRHIGITGTIEHIEGEKISFADAEKNVFETEKKYAVPIGEKIPSVTV